MLLRLIINTFSVIITSFILGGVHLKGFFSALLVAIVIGFLNVILKPLLILLTIPITILTFGFFLLVINAAMVLLAGNLVPGFAVDGFWWAVGFSIILTIINSIFMPDKDHNERLR